MLPKLNNFITIKRLENTSGKKDYNTTIISGLEVYLYASDTYESYFATQEVESSLERFKMVLEYSDIEENDEIEDQNGEIYKVHKVDKKDSAGVRPTFYQCLLIKSYAKD